MREDEDERKDQWLSIGLQAVVVVSCLVMVIVAHAAPGTTWSVPIQVGCATVAAAALVANIVGGLRAWRGRRRDGPEHEP